MVPQSEGAKVPTLRYSSQEPLFNIGDQLTCCDGSITTVIELNQETFLCDDGIWRYDRDHELERGRVTGTHSWPPHPKTIAATHPLHYPQEVVAALAACPSFGDRRVYTGGETVYNSNAMMREICERLDKMFHMKLTGEIM